MKSLFLTAAMGLIALASVLSTTGCASVYPAQRRTRAMVMATDRENMLREIDWMLGMDRPSTLTKPTVTPYW